MKLRGEQDLDLGVALEILNRDLGIERLLLDGGGGTNEAFLRAGVIDEISLAIFRAVDVTRGAPCVFYSRDEEADAPAPVPSMRLESSQVPEGRCYWLQRDRLISRGRSDRL
jgi:riboflavin biosynthesis pyrimidine reductase